MTERGEGLTNHAIPKSPQIVHIMHVDRLPEVKEHKQAEFLVENRLAWQLVSRIGVMTERTRRQVANALAGREHQPRVEVQRDWYY